MEKDHPRKVAFRELVQRKFGTERGYKAKAATALAVAPCYFSTLIGQGLDVAEHYFATLNALPDHIVHSPRSYDPTDFARGEKHTLPVNLSPGAYDRLKALIQRYTRTGEMTQANIDMILEMKINSAWREMQRLVSKLHQQQAAADLEDPLG